MKRIFTILFKIYFFIMSSYVIHLALFEFYIYPKLGIYFSQNTNRIKIGCAKGFSDVSNKITRKYTFIDGEKFNLQNTYLHLNVSFIDVNHTSIPFYGKQTVFENDLQQSQAMGLDRCHKIKYISIINLGFWRKVYLYDYIRN